MGMGKDGWKSPLREDLSRDFQKVKWGMWIFEGRAFKAEGPPSKKALRQDYACHVQGQQEGQSDRSQWCKGGE